VCNIFYTVCCHSLGVKVCFSVSAYLFIHIQVSLIVLLEKDNIMESQNWCFYFTLILFIADPRT
jgi:hypothetical protein